MDNEKWIKELTEIVAELKQKADINFKKAGGLPLADRSIHYGAGVAYDNAVVKIQNFLNSINS